MAFYDDEFGAIVAILPDQRGIDLVTQFNAKCADEAVEEDPISFGEGGNSIPHLSLFHMWMKGKDALHYVGGRMELISQKLAGEIYRVELSMRGLSRWRDGWVFWWPQDLIQHHNFAFEQLRRLVLIPSNMDLPRARSRDHEEEPLMTANRVAFIRQFGWGYMDIPHVTIARVRSNVRHPPNLQREYRTTVHFDRLVLAKRGPNGTIERIIHSVPIGR